MNSSRKNGAKNTGAPSTVPGHAASANEPTVPEGKRPTSRSNWTSSLSVAVNVPKTARAIVLDMSGASAGADAFPTAGAPVSTKVRPCIAPVDDKDIWLLTTAIVTMDIKKVDLNTTFNTFFVLAYLITDVPGDLMHKINNIIDAMLHQRFQNSVPVNDTLVGLIQNEYLFQSPPGDSTVDEIEEFTGTLSQVYWQRYGRPDMAKKKHVLDTMTNGGKSIWANFQKKHEYNPMHSHKGSLSWVLWCRIPYAIDQEIMMPHILHSAVPPETKGPSFQFLYPDFSQPGGVSQHAISVDQSYQGKIILFNSQLKHMVSPFFTSDGYRISLAGNMVVRPSVTYTL